MSKPDYLNFKPAAGDKQRLRALAAAQGVSVSEAARWCMSSGLRSYARRLKVVAPQVSQERSTSAPEAAG